MIIIIRLINISITSHSYLFCVCRRIFELLLADFKCTLFLSIIVLAYVKSPELTQLIIES